MIEISTVESPEPGRRGPTRWVIAGAAVAVLAGALGYVAGRAGDDGTGGTATSASTTTSAGDGVGQTTAGAPPISTTMPPSTAAVEARAPSGYGADQAMSSTSSSGGGWSYYPGAYPEDAGELLAERLVGDVTVRVHLQAHGDQGAYWPDFPDWAPAPWCYPVGGLRIGVASPTVIGTAWASYYSVPRDGLSVSTFSAGYVEGDPLFGAVVQVDEDAVAVALNTASGSDSATPQNGLVLLVVRGPIDDNFTITVDHADGSSSTSGAAQLAGTWDNSAYRNACEPPPPALPPAGEQPADPAAAEAAIRDAWSTVHGASADGPSRAEAVDDPTGLADAWAALADGQYASAAVESETNIAELVFTATQEAWFRYDLITPVSNFYDRYGQARLLDGRWVITRQTICQDLALAPGAECAPGVTTLLPPSAAGDPRYATAPDTMPYDLSVSQGVAEPTTADG